jgi:hypothetical protein
MKLVRIASANGAALELLSAAYVQEASALWRMIDEACGDIVLMAVPLGEAGALSDHRRRVIDALNPSSVPSVLGTRSLTEAVQSQANYLFRSLIAVELVARRASRADVVERACGLAAELARTTDQGI